MDDQAATIELCLLLDVRPNLELVLAAQVQMGFPRPT